MIFNHLNWNPSKLLTVRLRYGLLFRSTCIKNLFLAKCKCNRHKSRIEWSFVRFRSWYNCSCMSYCLLYRWCILFSQIISFSEMSRDRNPRTICPACTKQDCHILLFSPMKKHEIFCKWTCSWWEQKISWILIFFTFW